MRLYALVDGVQYRSQCGESLSEEDGILSLFSGTTDAALAHAGPWLVDVEQIGSPMMDKLRAVEEASPGVSWLIVQQTVDGLAQLLQLKLDAELPDGRTALIRFWDPRVLVSLAEVLNPTQREAFFGHIHEWLLLHEGRRVRIGRDNAEA